MRIAIMLVILTGCAHNPTREANIQACVDGLMDYSRHISESTARSVCSESEDLKEEEQEKL